MTESCGNCEHAINKDVKVSYTCNETMYQGLGCIHAPGDRCQFKSSRFQPRSSSSDTSLDKLEKKIRKTWQIHGGKYRVLFRRAELLQWISELREQEEQEQPLLDETFIV